jgi:hypothetical protein
LPNALTLPKVLMLPTAPTLLKALMLPKTLTLPKAPTLLKTLTLPKALTLCFYGFSPLARDDSTFVLFKPLATLIYLSDPG